VTATPPTTTSVVGWSTASGRHARQTCTSICTSHACTCVWHLDKRWSTVDVGSGGGVPKKAAIEARGREGCSTSEASSWPLLAHRHRSRCQIGPCVSPVMYDDACNTMTHAMTVREARCGRESGPWSKRPAMRSMFRPTECARASTACIARRRRRKALQVTTP
jgi:hypothetical protein